MIGYKIAKHGAVSVIVTLEIPTDAQTNMTRSNIAIPETAKYRANKVVVLQIEDTAGTCYNTATSCGYSKKSIEYVVGTTIEEPCYNTNIEEVCTEGIHYFLSRRVAELYTLKSVQNGLFEMWHDNGQLAVNVPYRDGKREGLFQSWYENGQKEEEVKFKDGKEYGLCYRWYSNGCKKEESNFKEGKQYGLCKGFYINGLKCFEVNIIN